MIELYEMGDKFLQTLRSLGEFLLDTKIDLSFDFLDTLSLVYKIINWNNPDADPFFSGLFRFYDSLELSGEYTLAALCFGGGLIFIIAFKVVKFFTDIIF